jgi:hypothetical protein
MGVYIKPAGLIREGVSMMKRLMVVLVLCAAAVWNIPALQGDFEIENGVLTGYRGRVAEVVVPADVTAIGEGAFSGSGIRSVTLPANLTRIGEWAFYGCESLTAIRVDKANRVYADRDGVLFNKALTELIAYPAGKTASSYAVPARVTSIGDMAFAGCSNLGSVTLHASLTRIGMGAFAGTGLVSITLPAGLTRIGEEVFDDCYDLKSITLLSPKPPALDGGDLGLVDETIIYVPAAALSAYRNGEDWEYYQVQVKRP